MEPFVSVLNTFPCENVSTGFQSFFINFCVFLNSDRFGTFCLNVVLVMNETLRLSPFDGQNLNFSVIQNTQNSYPLSPFFVYKPQKSMGCILNWWLNLIIVNRKIPTKTSKNRRPDKSIEQYFLTRDYYIASWNFSDEISSFSFRQNDKMTFISRVFVYTRPF